MTDKHGVNRRVRRTKRVIKEAYSSLIQEKGYSNITVKDIVERADYNRSSFYNYYTCKEALTEELVEEIIEGFKEANRQPYKQSNYLKFDTLSPSSVTIFQYIYEHASYFRLLIAVDPIPGLLDQIVHTINLLQKEITFTADQHVDRNGDHFITFRTYGFLGLILEWIQSNYERSPVDLAKQLIEICSMSASSIHINN